MRPPNVTELSISQCDPAANPTGSPKSLVRTRRVHLEWWFLCSQVTVMWGGALLSWRWLNTGLAMERGRDNNLCPWNCNSREVRLETGLKRLSPAQETSM